MELAKNNPSFIVLFSVGYVVETSVVGRSSRYVHGAVMMIGAPFQMPFIPVLGTFYVAKRCGTLGKRSGSFQFSSFVFRDFVTTDLTENSIYEHFQKSLRENLARVQRFPPVVKAPAL